MVSWERFGKRNVGSAKEVIRVGLESLKEEN